MSFTKSCVAAGVVAFASGWGASQEVAAQGCYTAQFSCYNVCDYTPVGSYIEYDYGCMIKMGGYCVKTTIHVFGGAMPGCPLCEIVWDGYCTNY